MDPKGNYAAHTGPGATTWAGNKGGKYCTAQGNILAGEAVVANMVKAFEETPGRCRCVSSRRSKADRPAAAIPAASNRRRFSS